jgi:hypothetical protein
MDEDNIVILAVKRAQPIQHRVLPLRSAGNNLPHLFYPVFFNHLQAAEIHLFCRDNNDNLVNAVGLLKQFEGMGKYRFAAKQQVLLVDGFPHPTAHAGCRD